MKLRNTIVLIVIALLLGGYVFFFEVRKDQAAEESVATSMFNVAVDDVVALTLEDGEDSVQVYFSPNRAKWMMDQPAESEADSDRIRRTIAAVVRAEAKRTIARDEAGDLSDFGLTDTALRVVLKLSNDDELVLLIGNGNPDGTLYYTMKPGGDEIYLVDKDAVDIVKKLVDEPPYLPTPLPSPTLTQ